MREQVDFKHLYPYIDKNYGIGMYREAILIVSHNPDRDKADFERYVTGIIKCDCDVNIDAIDITDVYTSVSNINYSKIHHYTYVFCNSIACCGYNEIKNTFDVCRKYQSVMGSLFFYCEPMFMRNKCDPDERHVTDVRFIEKERNILLIVNNMDKNHKLMTIPIKRG